MTLDLQTSLVISVFTLAVAGCLLLLSWLHHRGNQALAQWGAAFFLGAMGMALIGERGRIPDVWSIVAANAAMAAAYGIVWQGARTFEGRSSRLVLVYAGAAIWILACAIPDFYTTGTARAVLITGIGIVYTLLRGVFDLGDYYLLISGLGLIITALLNPVGIAGATREQVAWVRRKLTRSAPPPGDPVVPAAKEPSRV